MIDIKQNFSEWVTALWEKATGNTKLAGFNPESPDDRETLRQAVAQEKVAAQQAWLNAPLYEKAASINAIDRVNELAVTAEIAIDLMAKRATVDASEDGKKLPNEKQQRLEEEQLREGNDSDQEKSALLLPGDPGYANQFITRLKARFKQASGEPMVDAEVDVLYEEHKHDAMASGQPIMARDYFERSIKDPNLNKTEQV